MAGVVHRDPSDRVESVCRRPARRTHSISKVELTVQENING